MPFLSVLVLTACAPAFANLILLPTFDSTSFGTLSAANQATVKNTINAVIATYQTDILDSITVRITFDINQSVLGQTTFNAYQVPYSSFITALTSHAVSADDFAAISHLPFTDTLDPVSQKSYIEMKAPLIRALGIDNFGANATTLDGTIALGTNQMNLSRTGAQNSSFYDLQSVVSHEIDEVLGLGSSLGTGFAYVSPEDLFRYAGAGSTCAATGGRSYTASSSAIACFSINGAAGLARFNQPGNNGSDYGDWASSGTVHVQDAFATPGAQPNLGIEWRALDVIGYNVSAATTAPEPGTSLLFAAGCGLLAISRRRERLSRNASTQGHQSLQLSRRAWTNCSAGNESYTIGANRRGSVYGRMQASISSVRTTMRELLRARSWKCQTCSLTIWKSGRSSRDATTFKRAICAISPSVTSPAMLSLLHRRHVGQCQRW